MKRVSFVTALGLTATIFLGAATAHETDNPAVTARMAIMQLYANNLGQLGAMAKGNVEYSADAATAAANNLGLLVQLDQSTLWPAGTDTDSISNTRALPEIWQNFPDVMAKGKALSEAVTAMQAAAGTDLASLQGAMGALGGACGACHKAYRAPE
ncbi:cytochrome c [uncultured Shimia sp.]|uniref:c-type cytochrome n=1 Tax=uncultured Shimia sp. TaxID=573152 RepID=UPI0026127C15|nr:cytochrome c [uncultured Shimia sp.]